MVNDEGGSENNIKYDMEFLDGVFTHLALVNNPRYERANIVFNSKTEFVKDNKMDIENEKNEKGRWVTIKGTHVFIPEGKTIEDVIESKFKPYSEAIERDKKQLAYLKEKMDDPDNSPEKRETLVGQYQELKRRIKYYEEQDKKQKEKSGTEGKGDDAQKSIDKLSKQEAVKLYDKIKDDGILRGLFSEEDIKKGLEGARPGNYMSDEIVDKVNKFALKLGEAEHMDCLAQFYKEVEDEYFKNKLTTKSFKDIFEKHNPHSMRTTGQLKKLADDLEKGSSKGDVIFTTPMSGTAQEIKKLDDNKWLYTYGKDNYKDIYEQKEMSTYDVADMLANHEDGRGNRYYEKSSIFRGSEFKYKRNKANNSKEREMEIIEKLKELIFSVENEKEQDMEAKNEKVDKRKLIDEVAGIMKSAGCDDEDIRTAIGKMEKLGYDDSEKSADNEKDDDKKDDEVKNCGKKVKNEDEEDEKEVKEVKEDVKEDVENKCKNSVDNAKEDYFEKLNKIYNSASSKRENKTEYMSRADREKAAEDYFTK